MSSCMAVVMRAGSLIDVMVNQWDTGSALSSSLTVGGKVVALDRVSKGMSTGFCGNNRALKGE
jgi:hypothetical protein